MPNQEVFTLSAMFSNVEHYPDQKICGICLDGEFRECTYSFIFRKAIEKASWLKKEIGEKQLRLLLDAPNSLDWLIWDFASLIAGVPIIAASPGIYEEIGQNKKFDFNEEEILLVSDDINIHLNTVSKISPQVLWAEPDVELTFPELSGDRDLLSYVFSSGSTGLPKGLLVSRLGVESLVSDFITDFSLCASDSTLIFLPLSNFQQRSIIYGCIHQGAGVCVCQPAQSFHYLTKYSPSFLIAPPVFYDYMHRLCGKKVGGIERGLGGQIRFLISGMAPIDEKILRAYDAEGVPIYEAYGMTEIGMIAWNTPKFNKIGTVGKPLSKCEVSITSEGEVLVRREHPLCSSYFSENNNQFACGKHGEIETGDIGFQDADGFITLRGRKKNIFISRTGEKFCAEENEIYIKDKLNVRACYLLTNGCVDNLVCYLVLNENEAVSNLDVKIAQVVNRKMPGIEISKVVIGYSMPSVEDGTLTSNMKPDRNRILQVYCDI